MLRQFLLAFLVATVSACATTPAQIRLTEDDSKGLVVMIGQPAPIGFTMRAPRYDQQQELLSGTLFGPRDPFFEAPASSAPHLMLAEAEPGRYIFNFFRQQRQWGVCFHAESVTFEVRPGEVVFLGRFDPNPHLQQIGRFVEQSTRTILQKGEVLDYFEGVTPPAITPPSDSELSLAETMLRSTAPGVTAPIRAVEKLESGRFKTVEQYGGPQCTSSYAY